MKNGWSWFKPDKESEIPSGTKSVEAKWNSDLVKKDMEMAKGLNGLVLKITAGTKLTPKKINK